MAGAPCQQARLVRLGAFLIHRDATPAAIIRHFHRCLGNGRPRPGRPSAHRRTSPRQPDRRHKPEAAIPWQLHDFRNSRPAAGRSREGRSPPRAASAPAPGATRLSVISSEPLSVTITQPAPVATESRVGPAGPHIDLLGRLLEDGIARSGPRVCDSGGIREPPPGVRRNPDRSRLDVTGSGQDPAAVSGWIAHRRGRATWRECTLPCLSRIGRDA